MLYEISIYWRFTHLSSFGDLAINRKIVEVDCVGLFVYYDTEDQLTNENIRRHLIGRERKTIVVEGGDVKNALEKFYNEVNGAKTGGEPEESKALWVDRNEPIRELPDCKLLHKNKNGEFTCGKPEKDGNGELGMCILENYDPPENCPISLFYRINNSEDSHMAFKEEKFSFGGLEYSVIKPSGFYNRIKYSYKNFS